MEMTNRDQSSRVKYLIEELEKYKKLLIDKQAELEKLADLCEK